jgi:hypothetical protein
VTQSDSAKPRLNLLKVMFDFLLLCLTYRFGLPFR